MQANGAYDWTLAWFCLRSRLKREPASARKLPGHRRAPRHSIPEECLDYLVLFDSLSHGVINKSVMKSLIAVLLLSLSVFVNQTCGVDCDKLKERNGWRTLKLGMNPADALRELKRLCAPLEGVANEQLIEQDKEMTRTKIVSVSKQKLGGLTAGTSKIDRLSLTFFDDKLCD